MTLLEQATATWSPPPTLTGSEWADSYRVLSAEASAEPGRWRTDRAPYQRAIIDSACSSAPMPVIYRSEDGQLMTYTIDYVEQVVVMSSAQVGKTEILLTLLGFSAHYDPSATLLLQPTVEMAETFSKDRLSPMIRDTPALSAIIADNKSRSSGNTILHKTFPGGHITMAGANSPASLASRPIRRVLADEVDRYPVSAGDEGDPFMLARKRSTTFWNRKIVAVSTPTVQGRSRIEQLYDDSTQEQYCLACPSCGHHQALAWRHIVFEPVGAACEACGEIHPEQAWKAKPGIWIARQQHASTRGFQLTELVSPWRRWAEIIADFRIAKKSPETLKTWVNTSMGEPWEEEGERVDPGALFARREHYDAEVPTGVLVLTCQVDVQDDRLEALVSGWGIGEEHWPIVHEVWHGDPARQELWQALNQFLAQRFTHACGARMTIECTVIDSGGHFTEQVYKFVRPREGRRVFAIKGANTQGAPLVSRPSRSNLGKVKLFMVGVSTAKELVMARYQIADGPGAFHLPIADWCDSEFCEQLTAEKKQTRYRKGLAYVEWVKTRPRNEAFDLVVYGHAALAILNPNFEALAANMAGEDHDPQPEAAPAPAPPRPDAGWLNVSSEWL